jgi:hypothetical protein
MIVTEFISVFPCAKNAPDFERNPVFFVFLSEKKMGERWLLGCVHSLRGRQNMGNIGA